MSFEQNNSLACCLTDKTSAYNAYLLQQLREGDRVEFPRTLYSHWGIYVGNGDIVHLSGEGNDGINGAIQSGSVFSVSGVIYDKARVHREEFLKVAGDSRAIRNNNKDKCYRPLPAWQIVQRALSKVGDTGYNVITSNCEHFVNWCRYDKAESDQVENVKIGAALTGAASLAVIGNALDEKIQRNKDNGEENTFENVMAGAAKAGAVGLAVYGALKHHDAEKEKEEEKEVKTEENSLVALLGAGLAVLGSALSESGPRRYQY